MINDTVEGRPSPNKSNEEEEYYTLLKKVFHLLAPYYDALFALLSFGGESRLRKKVVEFAGAGLNSRILDIATGTGGQAFAFAAKSHQVVGIDLSEDMLKVAKKKNAFEKVGLTVADATNLPFWSNSFDLACVSFALHDMPLSIREKVLREMVRVTKTTGTIIIVDYASPRNKISRFLVFHFVKLFEHYYPGFIKSDLKGLLKKSGIWILEEHTLLLGSASIRKGVIDHIP